MMGKLQHEKDIQIHLYRKTNTLLNFNRSFRWLMQDILLYYCRSYPTYLEARAGVLWVQVDSVVGKCTSYTQRHPCSNRGHNTPYKLPKYNENQMTVGKLNV